MFVWWQEWNHTYAYLKKIVDSVPDHSNKISHNLFAGAGLCLWFVKNATSVNYNKAKCNKTSYVCRGREWRKRSEPVKYKVIEKARGDGSSIKQNSAKKQSDFLRIRGHQGKPIIVNNIWTNYVLPYDLHIFRLFNLSYILTVCFSPWLVSSRRKTTCLIYLIPSTVSWHSAT